MECVAELEKKKEIYSVGDASSPGHAAAWVQGQPGSTPGVTRKA